MGNAAGREWPAESATGRDPETGATVRRLTGYFGHSQHLYFTNLGWHAGGKRLLFGSHRNGKPDLYSVSLADGGIIQVTDLAPAADFAFHLHSCLNPVREEAFFWHGKTLKAVDLGTFKVRSLFEQAGGWGTGLLNCTADGKLVCFAAVADPGETTYDMTFGYPGFRELWASHPTSRVVGVPTDGSPHRILHEEGEWIGHVNTSPRLPEVLTFCHEGPWDMVDQRIWGLHLPTGRAWKIRPSGPGELAGHEYWLADGVTVGYHGGTPAGPVFGFSDWEGKAFREFVVDAHDSWHFHSRDDVLVVGDGTATDPYLFLWRIRDGKAEGPRRLCWHRNSFHTQVAHCHPAVAPDGKSVLFASDNLGYSNVYLADIPPFDSLPEKGTKKQQLF